MRPFTTAARLAIERLIDDAFIGWCAVARFNPDYRSASMGYCLDEAAWGHGYATEAGRALLQWALDTLDLNRVQAEADTRSAASARVLQKLGFVREGTLREDFIVGRRGVGLVVYGLLRRQWRTNDSTLDPRLKPQLDSGPSVAQGELGGRDLEVEPLTAWDGDEVVMTVELLCRIVDGVDDDEAPAG
jgi:GNAT superfamily N-acetyltransferase